MSPLPLFRRLTIRNNPGMSTSSPSDDQNSNDQKKAATANHSETAPASTDSPAPSSASTSTPAPSPAPTSTPILPPTDSDPIIASALISITFLCLCLLGLSVPSTAFFDEIYYLPAAKAILEGSEWLNPEHPMMGKVLIAASIALFGDDSTGWRFASALAGSITLFAFMRAMWFASYSRFAAIAFGILLSSGFILFIHSRIAMLDIFMVCFFAMALWQCAAALRCPEKARMHLILAGIALGLSMGSKWNVMPLAMLPGLAFFVERLTHIITNRGLKDSEPLLQQAKTLLLTRDMGPIKGVSLLQAILLLGILPLLIYIATFAPALMLNNAAYDSPDLITMHMDMIAMQQSVVAPHTYQSTWVDWMFNIRAIWYLYEEIDGAQRGILLIGNPLTMLLGLPAMVWCLWRGISGGRSDALAVALLYAVALIMWIVAAKPVQFYYHYFLPSCFLLAGLALALDAIYQGAREVSGGQVGQGGRGGRGGYRWLAWTILALSLAIFIWFYPIISARPLEGGGSFAFWMWLDSWR